MGERSYSGRFRPPPPAGLVDEDAALRQPEPGAGEYLGDSPAVRVLTRHSEALLHIDGVQGTAISTTPTGEVILVYVRDADTVTAVPAELESVPVQTVVTGPIRPL